MERDRVSRSRITLVDGDVLLYCKSRGGEISKTSIIFLDGTSKVVGDVVFIAKKEIL